VSSHMRRRIHFKALRRELPNMRFAGQDVMIMTSYEEEDTCQVI